MTSSESRAESCLKVEELDEVNYAECSQASQKGNEWKFSFSVI